MNNGKYKFSILVVIKDSRRRNRRKLKKKMTFLYTKKTVQELTSLQIHPLIRHCDRLQIRKPPANLLKNAQVVIRLVCEALRLVTIHFEEL